ncbi:nose resistant to fluoxetine protein 6-like [Malaya genurostris]|uniref:nose resistant to fluoxetine protein 6-like n=1 Tax=Malaya genurostris TaxID=325434 RepID=UPI0026F3D249|nr:nose resistant to fluoxetine protein 6-like [Malaya genurostris]
MERKAIKRVSIIILLMVNRSSIVMCSGQNALCEDQLEAIRSGFNDKKSWALELFDSWGTWPSGQFSGNQYDFGSFDQCLGYSYNHVDVGLIRGKYCIVVLPRLLDNLTEQNRFFVDMKGIDGVGIGSCFPNTCNEEQHLHKSMERLIEMRFGIVSDHLTIYCENNSASLGTAEVTAIILFSLIFGAVIASTMYDVFGILNGRKQTACLTTFSVYSNWAKLTKITETKQDQGSKSEIIECLHGVRVLAIMWIIYGHSYMLMMSAPLINPASTIEWTSSFYSALVIAGPISVDTFFLLSGLLICWSMLKELDRNKKLNVCLLYVHRYLRITPAFAALLLFTVGIYPLVSSGPVWNSTLKITVGNCNTYWWSALLHIQNYVNPNEMCLGHSWYLSVDMQLFLLSPFIIYPLWRWGHRIAIAIALLIVTSMAFIFSATLKHDLRANIMFSSLEQDRYSYVPTHTRMGAWFVGIVLGYILHSTKDHVVQLSKSKIILGWISSLALMLMCIFGGYPLNQFDSENNPIIADALYESAKHVMWAVSTSWIIFACTNGYAGPVNKILCLSVWQPLGKLSYCMYLVHLPVQMILTGSLRTVRHFSDLHTIHTFWGDFMFTAFVSIIWTLCFEIPFGNLDMLLLRSKRKGVNN